MVERNPGGMNFGGDIEGIGPSIRNLRTRTLDQILRHYAGLGGDDPAIVHDDDRKFTYGELEQRSNQLANRLLEEEVGRGSRIVYIAENRPEFAEFFFAAAKLGVLLATPLPRLAREKTIHCTELVDPELVVISDQLADRHEWLRNAGVETEVLRLGGTGDWGRSYSEFLEAGSPEAPDPIEPPRPEDGLSVIYTSGTTGVPKAAVVSHRALLARAQVWPNSWRLNQHKPDSVVWNPLAHVAGLELFVAALLAGGTCYTIDGFTIESFLDRVNQANVPFVMTFPGVNESILEYARQRDTDFRDLGVDIIGTTPDLCSPKSIQQLTRLFDAEFLNGFGQTEVGLWTQDTLPVGRAPSTGDLNKVPVPFVSVRIVDEEGRAVDPGEVGEALLRGPTLFSGYLNNETANRDAIGDGWFHTGDMFRMRADGTLDFVDRQSNMIKSGGENIYPAEIENALLDHPEVSDACVVPTPDEKWGEVPRAFVIRGEEASLTGRELLEDLEKNIARFKLPHYLEFVDRKDVPRGPHGEILREEIKQWDRDPSTRVRSP